MSTPKKQIENLHRSDLYLYFYEDSLTGERTRGECDFIERACQLKRGQAVLDLACGHGRHALELASRKYELTGVDINADFLRIAREAASAAELDIEYIEGDILQTEYESRFDLVLLLFSTLGFFDRSDLRALFSRISSALNPGGLAFIDTKNRDHIAAELNAWHVTEKGKDLMIDRISFDPLSGTTTNRRVYVKDGVRYEAPFNMYMYNYHDLSTLATAFGLKVKKVFGNWKGDPLDSSSRRIILILQK